MRQVEMDQYEQAFREVIAETNLLTQLCLYLYYHHEKQQDELAAMFGFTRQALSMRFSGVYEKIRKRYAELVKEK